MILISDNLPPQKKNLVCVDMHSNITTVNTHSSGIITLGYNSINLYTVKADQICLTLTMKQWGMIKVQSGKQCVGKQKQKHHSMSFQQ